MREIEVKAQLKDPRKTLEILASKGIELSKPKKQHDVVYGTQDSNGQFIHGSNWLRIRTENDTTVYCTLKRSVNGELDNIEIETIVADGEAMTALFVELGFRLYSDLTKIRRTAYYQDMEICFDEVPELGTFMELEMLCDEDVDGADVKAKLWDVFASFGVTEEDQVQSGYDVLLREHQGLGR